MAPLRDQQRETWEKLRSAILKCASFVWPGRALQDGSSKTDERESCNNVSGL